MKRVLKLEGLDCADCAAKLENRIKALEGVKNAGINFITLKCNDIISMNFIETIHSFIIRKSRTQISLQIHFGYRYGAVPASIIALSTGIAHVASIRITMPPPKLRP